MVIKTFSIQEETYDKFYKFCKSHGVSMSKQIEMFMESMIEDEPEAKEEYIKKLNRIKKGKFIQVKSFADRYGL
jgi:antitoxin component of RelBE/YafQ-DinJ toxin-antitoxin module